MTDETTPSDIHADLPSDDDLREQITNYDIADVGADVSIVGDPRISLPTKATAFAPDARQAIYDKLKAYPPSMHEEKEAELVAEEFNRQARMAMIRIGPGPNATPYQQTQWEISREVAEAHTAYNRAKAALDEVDGFDADGTPRYAIREGSQRRRALEAELDRCVHAIGMSGGIEGENRLAAAFKATANQIRERIVEQRTAAEIDRRAAKMVVEDRINAAAASKARFLKPTGRS